MEMIIETLLIILICSIICDDTETDDQKNDKRDEVSKIYANCIDIKKALGRNQAADIKNGKGIKILLAVFIMMVVLLCMLTFGIISIMSSCKTVGNTDQTASLAIEEQNEEEK